MISKIPFSLYRLYLPVTPIESLYLRLRWRLCPYELIEKFVPQKSKILDFGCGYGLFANYLVLKDPSRTVTGLDINLKRISIARRSIKNRKNISFYCFDIEDLNYKIFDVVVMTDVLHHLDNKKIYKVCWKINKLLYENGCLIILDVERTPFLKYMITYTIDRLLNLKGKLYYRPPKKIDEIMKDFHFIRKRTIRADKGLPLSDIIYIYKRSF